MPNKYYSAMINHPIGCSLFIAPILILCRSKRLNLFFNKAYYFMFFQSFFQVIFLVLTILLTPMAWWKVFWTLV